MIDAELKAFVEMGTKYKNVFSSSEGQAVLADIVWNILKTFSTEKKTEGDMVLSNAGAEILNYVACADANLTSNTIVKAVINVSPIPINKGENK